jgi:hypothetical protein
MNVKYFVKIQAAKLNYEIQINKMVIDSGVTKEDVALTSSVGEYLKSGENQFDVFFDWIRTESFEIGKAKLHVTIFTTPSDAQSAECLGKPLFEYVWPTPEKKEAYPQKLTKPFKIKDEINLRLWRDSEKIKILTPYDKREIFAELERFRKAFADKNSAQIYDIGKFAYIDVADSINESQEEYRKMIMEQATAVLSANSVTIEGLDFEEYKFDLICDGQLVSVKSIDDCSPIFIGTEFGLIQFKPIFSKVNGKWIISRMG